MCICVFLCGYVYQLRSSGRVKFAVCVYVRLCVLLSMLDRHCDTHANRRHKLVDSELRVRTCVSVCLYVCVCLCVWMCVHMNRDSHHVILASKSAPKKGNVMTWHCGKFWRISLTPLPPPLCPSISLPLLSHVAAEGTSATASLQPCLVNRSDCHFKSRQKKPWKCLETALDWWITSAGQNLTIVLKIPRASLMLGINPGQVATTLPISCRFALGIVGA